jgi:uncharacterized protein (DUF427 family)
MQAKSIKLPGLDHPITIKPNPARVTVSLAGRIIADTREALTLREASYPAVQYIPRKDVDMSLLQRTDHATYCPYKGDCAYYSIPSGGKRSANAVWTYEAPYAAVAEIKDHLAFYPDRVDEIKEQNASDASEERYTILEANPLALFGEGPPFVEYTLSSLDAVYERHIAPGAAAGVAASSSSDRAVSRGLYGTPLF